MNKWVGWKSHPQKTRNKTEAGIPKFGSISQAKEQDESVWHAEACKQGHN